MQALYLKNQISNLRTKIPMLPQSIPARITIPDASFFIILPPYIQKG